MDAQEDMRASPPDPHKDIGQPFIMWLDYGMEGWKPRYYWTSEEMLHGLLTGDATGYRTLCTQRLVLESKGATDSRL